MKRFFRRIFSRFEALFDWAFGQVNNPMNCLGALGWFFFWIAAASGIYLYMFFDTGISAAYASVEYMTNDQWYAAGVMRSLHRYASDALVVVVVIHILREFSLDRMRGKHFFTWLTGVPLLWFIYVCGISGYWLVWDKLAQFIAIATTEWFDTLPFFGEPIANNFLNSAALGDRFFTLVLFIHIFAPLFMLVLMWIHISRFSNAKVNPPRPLMIGTGITLLAVSLLYPAFSQAPADLDVIPVSVGLDWFYLGVYPLLDYIPGGVLWLLLVGVSIFLALMPWMPPQKPEPTAVVDLDNCNGCARCFDDCPYGAITMVPRSDGKAFDAEVIVSADLCMSCGICAGACPTSTPFRRAKPVTPGIELPHHRISDLREQTLSASEQFGTGERTLVYACSKASTGAAEADGAQVITMPCLGMLPPSFIDYAISRDLADKVSLVGCSEGDCYYRLGVNWTRQRIDGARDPYLRKRVPREKVSLTFGGVRADGGDE
jgi:quinol-cytochrome oxidoreductase complex cytochrome b subunit/Fe-S-cluster-containing hydrogenase component 2